MSLELYHDQNISLKSAVVTGPGESCKAVLLMGVQAHCLLSVRGSHTDQCNPRPGSDDLLFAVDSDNTETHKQSDVESRDC